MLVPPLRTAFAMLAVALCAAAAWFVGDAAVRTVVVLMLAGVAIALVLTGHRRDAVQTSAPARAAPHTPPSPAPPIAGLIDAIAHPVLIVAGGNVAFANPPARHLFGEFIGDTDFRTALRHPDIVDRLSRTPPSPVEETFDVIGVARSASPWRVSIVPLDDGRRVVQLIDQSDATRLDRMRADFVANASHELRTPLASILGFVETLEDDAAGGDPAMRARFLGIIGREAARMQQLVDDLLSMSRVESVKGTPPSTAVDIGAVIDGVVAELRGAGDPRSADIVTPAVAQPLLAVGDVAQLKQALHNIVGNAMKYGRAATPIDVRAEPHGDMIAIRVSDEGDGVAEEHLPRLTERFYRVDAARSRSVGGTGLGLSIVRHIVERHRGRMDIASKPGVGTVVTLLLPRALQRG